MQNKISELMNLSEVNIQKRLLASLIALIEDEKVYDDVKKEAIKVLPDIQSELNYSIKFQFESTCYCNCEDDCDGCNFEDCSCEGFDCPHLNLSKEKPVFCKCNNNCNSCEHQEKPCSGIDCGACVNPRSEE